MKKKFLKTFGIALAVSVAAASFAGCANGDNKKIDFEETAFIINGEEIDYATVNFIFRHDESLTNYYMAQLGMSPDDFWTGDDTSSEDGKSYAETFKETEYSSIVRMYSVRQKALNEYGVELTDEEMQEIEEAADQFLEANPETEANFGITREELIELLKTYTYSYAIKDSLTGDVDRNVSDDEAAQSRMIYVRIPKADESSTDEDAKTNDELKADLENAFEQIKEAGDIDAEQINEIADAVNEDIFAAEYTFGEDVSSFEDGVVDEVNALEDGRWCDDVFETDSYYYAVKMINKFDREATDQKKEQIIRERENEVVNEFFEQWEAEAEVETTEAWDSIEIEKDVTYTMKTS